MYNIEKQLKLRHLSKQDLLGTSQMRCRDVNSESRMTSFNVSSPWRDLDGMMQQQHGSSFFMFLLVSHYVDCGVVTVISDDETPLKGD